ncbi:MAG TPA: DRTGG domain-containing protein [Vicinamibacterales bacterium]|nr:DRTGG domain-containing protein [Vicinamibacterales bacterium]
MTVTELARLLDGAIVGPTEAGSRGVSGGYCSDLLSDVMANAEDGDAWITMQRHVNTVAVAQLKNLAAIVIVGGRQPEADVAARAAEHGVAVVTTRCPAFEAAGRLYGAGLRGRGAS